MKSRASPALALLLAAGLAVPAFAQTSLKSGDTYVYAPTTLGSRSPIPYVAEPNSSAATSLDGGNPTLDPLVQALNADASLKASKITVASDGEVILLTGVTITRDQMTRAMQIATSQAGEGKVINAIQSEELVVVVSAPPVTAPAPEAGQPEAEVAPATEAAPAAAASSPANPT